LAGQLQLPQGVVWSSWNLPEFTPSWAIEAAVEMLDFLLTGLFHVLSGMFVIGLLGCLLVIPITAYRRINRTTSSVKRS
jgi:hypothetical protein